MTIKIPLRKIDNKSAVIATNSLVLDVPILIEKEFDYDDSDGVVSELYEMRKIILDSKDEI